MVAPTDSLIDLLDRIMDRGVVVGESQRKTLADGGTMMAFSPAGPITSIELREALRAFHVRPSDWDLPN